MESQSQNQTQATSAKSYQVQMLLPNPSNIITSVFNFVSAEEAYSWGRAALSYLEGFIEITAWRVHPSDEPPTHVLKQGRPVKLGSFLRQ